MAEQYWWKKAQIYELYIDKFAGNILGLITKLDYIKGLGMNAIHILPHYPSPMIDNGYDVMDYLNVRPELGTLEDFDRLVRDAHDKGIKIIVDFVLNHVSEHHPWFIEARSSKKNPKRDFFLWSNAGSEFGTSWNAFPESKKSNWIKNNVANDYYFATFYPQQPDLNWDNRAVFDAMLSHMDFWADRGVDGFRLDATSHLVKREDPKQGYAETHDILKRIRSHLDTKYGARGENGNIILLAESHMPVEEVKAFFGNGDECQLAYHFPMAEALFQSLMLKSTKPLENMLARSVEIPENCAWAFFLRNHDEISFSTLPQAERAALLHFLDPRLEYPFRHGRETAVRLATIFKDEPKRIEEAFRLLYALPGAHIVYYGDEIGMQNLPRDTSSIDTRVFVRGTFNWDAAEKLRTDAGSLYSALSQITNQQRPLA